MDTNTFEKKYLPTIVIVGIVIALLILIFICFKLLGVVSKTQYESLQEEVNTIATIANKMVLNNENYIGEVLFDSKYDKKYKKRIEKINQEYNIDLLDLGYFYCTKEDLVKIGVEKPKREYVINYELNIVLTLQPVKYNKRLYYTSEEMEHRLKGEYTYDYPIIPDGFRKKSGTWDKGLIIVDDNGNEFVWIPVGYLNPSNPSEAFKKYYLNTSSYNNIEEYPKVLESVGKYGGFYMARYEASIEGATDTSSEGRSNRVKSVGNVMPITIVSLYNDQGVSNANSLSGYKNGKHTNNWNEMECAYELANGMAERYKWGENIHTTLMLNEHYDTFFKVAEALNAFDGKIDVTVNDVLTKDSTKIGNFENSVFRYVKNGNYISKVEEMGVIIPTGSQLYFGNNEIDNRNVIFNVYDIAGNVSERTAEKYLNSEFYVRGGDYASNGDEFPAAAYVKVERLKATPTIGFRVAMYID